LGFNQSYGPQGFESFRQQVAKLNKSTTNNSFAANQNAYDQQQLLCAVSISAC
jgi:hypothetical protein